jgi:hypothetical protein
MNAIFKIVMFTMFLNIATGIMGHMIPTYAFMCNTYSEAYAAKFNSSAGYVNPNNNLQDQTSAFIRLIDSLNIGIIGKFLNSINFYLYGSIDFIRCYIGMYDWLEFMLKSILTIGYILGSIYLWTGRAFNH